LLPDGKTEEAGKRGIDMPVDDANESTDLSELIPDSQNARKHGERNLALIASSLEHVGAARSIVVDEDGTILAGNATVAAAARAGIDRVRIVDADGSELIAVRRSGLSDDQKRQLALFDNRAAELASWDTEVLAALADETDLSYLWTGDELTELLAKADPPVVDFQEYDESAAEAVSWATCPECGHRFPK
jgi:ParB-like chromosome segregation protein Spo0J